ncbi:MAG: UDP-N-acetylmuramate dehydrogenase [Patescibacteria group bacterium]|nr:UDP-N-acetylmuramate dehydrogenase [Patescibacteria group bacterium]
MSNPLKIQQNISLKDFTTFKIGGEAKFFIEVENEDELKKACAWAKENSLPIFILGSGSNLLISDGGFDGLVVRMKNEKLKMNNDTISAGAGVNLNSLIDYCLKNNLVGLEGLSGIYGTLGGAVRGNAGAFGASISDFVESVRVFDLSDFTFKNFSKDECQFGYRESIFKKNRNLVIWSVELKLISGDTTEAKNKSKKIIEKRNQTQPSEPSAGCIFKNIKNAEFDNFLKNNPDINLSEKFLENKAVPAAWLIESCNLKGREVGGAKISDVHANFIVNTGLATAKDIIDLINLIKISVRAKFNLELEEEVEKIGF